MSRKVLSERFMNRRKQICKVSIKVNFLSWIVEFLGCFTIALDIMVVGSRNNAISGMLKILTMLVYLVILPGTFLVNSSAGINAIVDQSWFDAIFKVLQPAQENDSETSDQRNFNEERAPQAELNEPASNIPTISQRIAANSFALTEPSKTTQNVEERYLRRNIKIAWQ